MTGNRCWVPMAWAVPACLLVAGMTQAATVVHLTNGKSMQVQSLQWRESSQEYRLTMPDGTVLPLRKNQIERLEVDKPAEFDKASQMVDGKQYAQAIPILEAMISEYAMRVWDNQARYLLAQAYMGMNNSKKAAQVLDDYVAQVSKAQLPAEVILFYWNVLLSADRGASLKKELDDVIATGSREMVAAAQIMRGNLSRQAGQKDAALLDYLRVILLFESVKTVQPEALFRAAELLDEMRDPRAEGLRKKLVTEYKDSPYAAQLGGKM